jgi:HEPN domain-containing protein
MNGREEAQRLLLLARKDFKAMEGMLDAGQFDEEIFGFHAQQAVEKTLKTWLTFLNEEYPRTHDLSLLLGLLETTQVDVKPFLDLEELTVFAVQFRYEAFDLSDEPLERLTWRERVAGLIEHVERLLKTAK